MLLNMHAEALAAKTNCILLEKVYVFNFDLETIL